MALTGTHATAVDQMAETEATQHKGGPVIEIDGRKAENGLEPVRYGDWEKKGLISDF